MSNGYIQLLKAPAPSTDDSLIRFFVEELADLATAIEQTYPRLTADAISLVSSVEVDDDTTEIVLRIGQRDGPYTWDIVSYRFVDADVFVFAGPDGDQEVCGLEEFKEHLAGLLVDSDLRRSIEILDREAAYPHRARLSTRDHRTLAPHDVEVRLHDRAYQELRAARGPVVSVEIHPTEVLGLVDAEREYRFLTVEGSVWSVEGSRVRRTGDNWVLKVRRVVSEGAHGSSLGPDDDGSTKTGPHAEWLFMAGHGRRDLPTLMLDLERPPARGFVAFETSAVSDSMKRDLGDGLLAPGSLDRVSLWLTYFFDAGFERGDGAPAGPVYRFLPCVHQGPNICVGASDEKSLVAQAAPFWLSSGTVNNLQYRRFIVSTGRAKGKWRDLPLSYDAEPAVGVGYEDAIMFCNWCSERFPDGWTVILPSAEEWELAASERSDLRRDDVYEWRDAVPHASVGRTGTFGSGQPGEIIEVAPPVLGQANVDQISGWKLLQSPPFYLQSDWLEAVDAIRRLTSPAPEPGGFRVAIKGPSRSEDTD